MYNELTTLHRPSEGVGSICQKRICNMLKKKQGNSVLNVFNVYFLGYSGSDGGKLLSCF